MAEKSALEKAIREAVHEETAILGSKRTIEAIKKGVASTVVLSLSCSPALYREINYYAKLAGITIHRFNESSLRLGGLCGKPFRVSALAIVGQKKVIRRRKKVGKGSD